MTCCSRSLVLLPALVLLPLSGHCGPPFQTDDPNVVELGHVEFLAFYQSTLAATARSGTLLGLESHFGIHEATELDLVTPLAFDTPSGSDTARGYGDTTLGIKYQLIGESETTPMVSLVPKVTIPSGNSSRGLGNGGSQVLLAAAAQWHSGRFQTYANAGYWINNGTANRNYWFVGWQAQYAFSDAWLLGAEVFHTTPQLQGQPPSTGFNVGGYWVFDPHNQLLFSAGRGIQNAAATNRVSTYLGYQLSF